MARTSSRTTNIFTRIDPETKEQAEIILTQLGIPMSNAIGMFLKQVVIQRGIPFEMKLPSNIPLAIGGMSEDEIKTELEKGSDDIVSGKTFTAEEVETEMKRKYGI